MTEAHHYPERPERVFFYAQKESNPMTPEARKYAKDHHPPQERPTDALYRRLVQERYGMTTPRRAA